MPRVPVAVPPDLVDLHRSRHPCLPSLLLLPEGPGLVSFRMSTLGSVCVSDLEERTVLLVVEEVLSEENRRQGGFSSRGGWES